MSDILPAIHVEDLTPETLLMLSEQNMTGILAEGGIVVFRPRLALRKPTPANTPETSSTAG